MPVSPGSKPVPNRTSVSYLFYRIFIFIFSIFLYFSVIFFSTFLDSLLWLHFLLSFSPFPTDQLNLVTHPSPINGLERKAPKAQHLTFLLSLLSLRRRISLPFHSTLSRSDTRLNFSSPFSRPLIPSLPHKYIRSCGPILGISRSSVSPPNESRPDSLTPSPPLTDFLQPNQSRASTQERGQHGLFLLRGELVPGQWVVNR